MCQQTGNREILRIPRRGACGMVVCAWMPALEPTGLWTLDFSIRAQRLWARGSFTKTMKTDHQNIQDLHWLAD